MGFRKRGIVTAVRGRNCIVFTPDGTYDRIPLPSADVQIGSEVSYNRAVIPAGIKPLLMVASLLIVFLGSALWPQTPLKPVAAYVSLDINPSLEMGVDEELQVVEVTCLNGDAISLTGDEDFTGKSLSYVLAKLLNEAVEKNYIKAGEDNLIITTVSAVDSGTPPVDQREILQVMEKSIAAHNRHSKITILTTSSKERNQANKQGISTGKYVIYGQLEKKGEHVSIDDVKQQSVNQLLKKYKMDLKSDHQISIPKQNRNGNEHKAEEHDKGKINSSPKNIVDHNHKGQHIDNSTPKTEEKHNVKSKDEQEPEMKDEADSDKNQSSSKSNNHHTKTNDSSVSRPSKIKDNDNH